MTNPQKLVAALALAAAGAFAVVESTREDPKEGDVKSYDAEKAAMRIRDDANIYKHVTKEGTVVYVAKTRDGGEVFVDKSPCAWKVGTKDDCTLLDGGNPGVFNTMRQWKGASCVQKACTIVAGEEEKR